MASESIVRIVINAVDKYSGVLTGLNQGLELVGKAFTGLSTVAVGSFNAIKTGLDSVKEGGDFLELRNQYESAARSFGTSGQKIIDVFDRIGQGTIGASDRVRLASKAISSALTDSEIEAAVAYTKKWTEKSKEDFAKYSEQVFEAFSKGKFSIFKTMDIFVDKTTSASDVLRQMQEGMARFSDTGSNVADSMGAVSTATEDAVLFFKAAIANSDTLQKALDFVAETARGLVRSFDFATVTQYFDTLIRAAGVVFDAVKETFSGIGLTIYRTFQNLRTDNGARDFFKGLGTYALESLTLVQKFSSLSIDAFTSLVSGFGRVAESVGFFGQQIKVGIAESFASVFNTSNRVLAELGQMVNEFIQSSPLLQNAFGAQELGNGITAFIKSTRQAKQEWDQILKDTKKEDSIFKSLDSWGMRAVDFAKSFDSAKESASRAIGELKNNLEKGFKDFDISQKKPFISDEIINKTSEQGEKLRELLRRQRDTQDLNEEKANAKKLETKEKQEIAAADRARKRQEDSLRQTLRDIEDLEKRISQNSFTVLSLDETQLLASKDKIRKAIEDIDAEARRRNLSVALDVAADPAKIKQIKDEIDKLGVKDGKLTIKADTTKPEPIPVHVTLRGGPTFFRELIQSAIVEAKGERVPLVFTAVPA